MINLNKDKRILGAREIRKPSAAGRTVVALETQTFGDLRLSPDPCAYACLLENNIYTLAYRQLNLTLSYEKKQLAPSSECAFELSSGNIVDGSVLIEQQMSNLGLLLHTRDCFVNFASTNPENVWEFEGAFRSRLEDPGFLLFVIYFGVASDLDFVCFLWDLWFRNGIHSKNFFKGTIFEPSGWKRFPASDGAWQRFCSIEATVLTSCALDKIWSARVAETALELSDGKMVSLPVEDSHQVVSLLDFTTTHTLENLKALLLSGSRQLSPGGVIAFDLPIKNGSLCRLTHTVGYPVFSNVVPYKTSGKAIKAAHEIVNFLNCTLRREAATNSSEAEYLDLEEIRILSFGSWGDTDAYVCLRKRSV